ELATARDGRRQRVAELAELAIPADECAAPRPSRLLRNLSPRRLRDGPSFSRSLGSLADPAIDS
ncbi:MAG: hypothetical protein L0221_14510, partial [Chloroflexi bacterium]|nr:hypothetical protein [Chloroflexota bacterium]